MANVLVNAPKTAKKGEVVEIIARPLCGPSRASKTCGCGFFSLKTWIALMLSLIHI